jgi:hypothetical protein
MVTVLFNHNPVTPCGKSVTVTPVAPSVANVIVVGVLIHAVMLIPAAIVFTVITVIVPVAVVPGQPPVVVTV